VWMSARVSSAASLQSPTTSSPRTDRLSWTRLISGR